MLFKVIGLFLLTFLFVPDAQAQQITLIESTHTHSETSQAFVNGMVAAGVPDDLTTDDYHQGTLHHRLRVTAKPSAQPMRYRMCLVQGEDEACSNAALSFDSAGDVTAQQSLSDFSGYADVDWSAAIASVRFVAMDNDSNPVDVEDNANWPDHPDLSGYYPLEVEYVAVLVAPGSNFEGFPGDPPVAAAPTFSPNGGTFQGSVNVQLSSATEDATIRYTTDGSDPNMSATEYDGPITITDTTTIRARAWADGHDPSPIASAAFEIVDMLDNGLQGRYYSGRDFGEFVVSRVDGQIEFTYDGETAPAPGVPSNNFSVVWSGRFVPRYSNNYTISTRNSDGVRLWVDNTLVIDDWNTHGPQNFSGQIQLQEGTQHQIWLEYFKTGGSGEVSLSWESAEQSEEVIPQSQLVPGSGPSTPMVWLMRRGPEEIRENLGEPVEFEIRRRGALDQTLRVELNFGGAAENGVDYEQLPAFIDIPTNALFVRFEVLPIDNDIVDGNRDVTIRIRESGNYDIYQGGEASTTIIDDDIDTFSIAGEVNYTGTESGNIVVETFTEEMANFQRRRDILIDPGPFRIEGLEEGVYTVIAYIDSNGNERLDPGERWAIFENDDFEPDTVEVPPGNLDVYIDLDRDPGGPIPGAEEEEGCGCATGPSGAAPAMLVLFAMMVVGRVRRRRERG